MAKSKMSMKDVVLAAAVAVCGKPPKTITPEQYEKITANVARKKVGGKSVSRDTVNTHLRRAGYKRSLTAGQNPKVQAVITEAFKEAHKLAEKDPAAVEKLKKKLVYDVAAVAKSCGQDPITWNSIRNVAAKMDLAGWPKVRVSSAKSANEGKSPEEILREKLLTFISRARTNKEILGKFGEEGLSELAKIVSKPPEGFRLKSGRNEYQEETNYLERIVFPKDMKVASRIFTILESENDPDYIAVIFPKDLKFSDDPSQDALRIIPIDSVFFSDYLCNTELFDSYLSYLANKPYAFGFLNGDIIGGHNYDKDTAVEIREQLKQRLAPIAHKILWAQSGPLEMRMTKVDGVEPLWSICEELGIRHTDRPVRADVYWRDSAKPIEFYAIHGRSNARKDGSKANAVIDIVFSQNFPHFVVLGHLKEGMANTLTVRRLDSEEFKVKEHSANAIVCPGFQNYEGSLAEKKGYPPPAAGTVVCIIDADNNHKASS